jgi:hypothetical protein
MYLFKYATYASFNCELTGLIDSCKGSWKIRILNVSTILKSIIRFILNFIQNYIQRPKADLH